MHNWVAAGVLLLSQVFVERHFLDPDSFIYRATSQAASEPLTPPSPQRRRAPSDIKGAWWGRKKLNLLEGKEETEGEEGVSPSQQRPPNPPEIKAVHAQRSMMAAAWEGGDPVRSEITPEKRAIKHVMEFIADVLHLTAFYQPQLKISVKVGDCKTTLYTNATSSHEILWSVCLRSQVLVCVDITEAPQTNQTIIATVKCRIQDQGAQEHRPWMEKRIKRTDKRSKLQNKTDY